MTDARTNEELAESAIGGLRWITVVRIASEVLLVISMVALARLIPPKAFGMFAVVVLVQEIAINLPDAGIGSALVQRASIDRRYLQAGLTVSLVIGLGLTVLTLAIIAGVVEPLFGGDTARLMLAMTPLFMIGAVLAIPSAVLRRRLDFRALSLLEMVGTLVRSLGTLLLAAAFHLDAAALAGGSVAAMVAVLACAWWAAPVAFPRWHRQEIRELLAYGGPASLSVIAWSAFRNCDYAIIAGRLGSAQAGFYWRGFQLAVEYQRKITSVMSYFGFPVLARTAGMDELLALRQRMVRLTTVMLFPLFVTLTLLAPVVIPWLLGPEWQPAVLPTQILTGAGAATVLTDNVGSALSAMGRAKTVLSFGVSHFVVYAVAVVFASRWGISGVAVAAGVVHSGFLVYSYFLMLEGRPEHALTVLWEDLAAATVSSLALVATCLPLDLVLRSAHTAALPHIAAVSALAGVVYLGTLRTAYPKVWGDLTTVIRRVVPVSEIRARLVSRKALAAGSRG
ncbi:MAG TPA: oligosaccharide flippase family protein [Baekduia sp.]